MADLPWLDYTGQTTDELLAGRHSHRIDSLVCAFELGIQRKSKTHGVGALTPEEHLVLALRALDREVNNGGYSQFFVNQSRQFVPIVVDSLDRVGCSALAAITRRAIAALQLPDPGRDKILHACDQEFYRIEGIAENLFGFIDIDGGFWLMTAANITNKNTWQVVSVADFNSDGHPDLLWEDPASGFSQIWYMGGSQGIAFLGAANLTQTNPWHIVGTGDFNLDGFPDVLWQDPVTGTVQIWYMGGTTPGQQGSQLQTAVNLPANKWHVMAIADFNQDGHPDIVYESPTTNAAQVFYYTGAQGTTPAGSAVLSGANPWYLAGPH